MYRVFDSTGMSYVNPNCSFCDFVHNQTAVNEHMYSALQSTMRIFPFLRDRSVYLTGESYAGHYIPSIADYIVVIGRGILPAGDHPISIAGLAIGNGWSVPVVQYNYGDFAYNIGLISKSAAAQLTAQYSRCRVQEARQDYSGKSFCNVLGEILAASGACPAQRWVAADDDDGESGFKRPSNSSRNSCFGPIVNYYDTRLYADAESNWPNGDNTSVYYLNLISVRKAIHSRRDIYVECSAAAGQYLAVLDGLGVQAEIESLLGANIPITFYNGQYDLICNHIGNGDMLSILKWSGADEFQRAAEYVWTVPQVSADGESIRYIPAGYARFTGDRRLQFVVVIGASHMVPYDVPRAALDLIRRVLRNESFGDYRQDLTWNFDDSRASAAEQEIDDLLWKAYEFIFRSPFSTDYVLILVCALFVTTMVCVSRGTCSRSTIYAYTRIPSNSDT